MMTKKEMIEMAFRKSLTNMPTHYRRLKIKARNQAISMNMDSNIVDEIINMNKEDVEQIVTSINGSWEVGMAWFQY